MVVASEYGYLELLLTRELPDYHLHFRNLAWEGDTVFEQRRDLNFPPLEAQLDKIGATVVIAQFGQMESLAGKEKLPEFIAAYEKLLERLSSAGKRRIVLIPPTPPPNYVFGKPGSLFEPYDRAVSELVRRHGFQALPFLGQIGRDPAVSGARHRDGIHLNASGQAFLAMDVTMLLPQYRPVSPQHDPPITDTRVPMPPRVDIGGDGFAMKDTREEAIRQLVIAKNRLWFHYWRPQNWAFLNGDRTQQPSSRDHLDPSKRWFPDEIEQFVPLIEAKEREIDARAEKLAKP